MGSEAGRSSVTSPPPLYLLLQRRPPSYVRRLACGEAEKTFGRLLLSRPAEEDICVEGGLIEGCPKAPFGKGEVADGTCPTRVRKR